MRCEFVAIPDGLLDIKPHEKTNTIRAILLRQLLSKRRKALPRSVKRMDRMLNPGFLASTYGAPRSLSARLGLSRGHSVGHESWVRSPTTAAGFRPSPC